MVLPIKYDAFPIQACCRQHAVFNCRDIRRTKTTFEPQQGFGISCNRSSSPVINRRRPQFSTWKRGHLQCIQQFKGGHLYRLFSDNGGVMQYIHERCLQRAYSLLTKSDSASAKIIAIRDSVGFKSDSHVNNAIKQRFGFSPTDLRNCKMPRPLQGSSKRFMIDAWFQSLRQ